MKKFDIELARQGKPVCNGDENPVRILCYDLKDVKCPIVGAVYDPYTNREILQKYTLNGCAYNKNNSNSDLFMETEEKSGWVNVFINASYFGSKTAGTIYPTKEEALKDVDTKSPHYIDTVKIEWEE